MNKFLKLECGCKFHKIDIEEFTIEKIEGSFLSICIYEHKSKNTGKLFKKPKLLADVILHPEEVKIFKKEFIND
jgi:hypothetical protein